MKALKLIGAAFALLALPALAVDERWETDYETALKKAQETDKHVFINFTGSDW